MSQYVSDQSSSHENLATASVLELIDLQKQLLSVARSVSPALLPFMPIFGKDPLPPEEYLAEGFISAARHKALFLGYTADKGIAFNIATKD